MFLRSIRDERGFTMMELLVASVVTVIVLGGAVAITSQIQTAYRRQMEDAVAEEEGRYALDWISRYLRGAANNPQSAATTTCPGPGTIDFNGFQFDPDADGVNNDVRVMSDTNPPDGLIGGTSGTCDQANEDVTISLDSVNHTITFFDNNTGGAVSTRTDTVIEDLRFTFLNSGRAELDTSDPTAAANVFWVRTAITVRTRTTDAATGQPISHTLRSEVKVRSRI